MYVYRTTLTPSQSFFILMDSVRVTNRLSENPRFYNVITANSATSLMAQSLEFREAPFDIRMLLSGKLDELIHERGGLVDDGLSFPELRQRAFINEVALAAHDDPEFSTIIRQGR